MHPSITLEMCITADQCKHLLFSFCVFAGEERWDIRMTAWLLHLLQKERSCVQGGGANSASATGSEGGSMWGQYLALLPPECEMCCLVNYSAEEARELQLPQLMVGVAGQE